MAQQPQQQTKIDKAPTKAPNLDERLDKNGEPERPDTAEAALATVPEEKQDGAAEVPLQRRQPLPEIDDHDLAQIDAALSDEQFNKLADARAKRLGDNVIMQGGKFFQTTGKYVVKSAIKHTHPTNGPQTAKAGEIVSLSDVDAKHFTALGCVEPELKQRF